MAGLRTTAVRPLSSPTRIWRRSFTIWRYDLDEQPRHIQNMAMWLNDETPIQMSWGRSATLTKRIRTSIVIK
jgi:hypothetical protein